MAGHDGSVPRSFGKEVIEDAKRLSPLSFLQRHYQGVEVNRRGDSIAVAGVLRADLKDGRWVACDWNSGAIGDNIALTQWVKPGTTFPDAIHELTGAQAEMPTRISTRSEKPADIRRPSIPYERGRGAGRDYLQKQRGISLDSIVAAEKAGALHYLDNAVVFLGRDDSKAIRAATLRHIKPVQLEDGSTLTKRDLADTDKTFPSVLPGNLARVVVVEGGINALAVRDMAIRRGEEPPTIVATGGVGVRKWITQNPALKDILERADSVTVMGEREIGADGKPDPIKQGKTDAARQQLADAIAGVRQGEVPGITMPPVGCKDVADWNRANQQPDPASTDDLASNRGYRR